MNDAVVNSVIQNLCDKFNVAASELVPRMQAYGLAMSKLGIIISGIFVALILLIYAVCMYSLYKKDKEGNYVDSDGYCFGTVCFLFSEVIPTVICIVNAVNYIGWKYAPEIKSMEYVMNMIK